MIPAATKALKEIQDFITKTSRPLGMNDCMEVYEDIIDRLVAQCDAMRADEENELDDE